MRPFTSANPLSSPRRVTDTVLRLALVVLTVAVTTLLTVPVIA